MNVSLGLKKSAIFSLVLVVSLFSLAAQDKARVAIIPFEAREVSQSEAQVMTELFETALVKTGVYNIIEQTDIEAIVEAQSYSLSGCVDDACAVEVGKLLSAELIVIGTLSKVGGQYIANAKFVDVALGKNVNADSVSAADIGEMTTSGATLLAYKLAGLTFSEGGTEQIASNFGEIYVGTSPSEADIFVNGMRRGTSPMVIEKIPFGQVVISARLNNLVGEETITINSSNIQEVELGLKIAYGRLFIKSSETAVDVYLNNRRLGPLGGGLFRDIEAGEHTLVLKGNGYFYSEDITVEEEQTLSIDAYPYPVGVFEYKLSSGEQISIINSTTNYSDLTDEGLIEGSRAGVYKLYLESLDEGVRESVIRIEKGSKYSFISESFLISKALQLSESLKDENRDLDQVNVDYQKFQRDLSLRSEYAELTSEIQELSSELSDFVEYRRSLYELESELEKVRAMVFDMERKEAQYLNSYKNRKFWGGTFPWILTGSGLALFAIGLDSFTSALLNDEGSIVFGAITFPVGIGCAIGGALSITSQRTSSRATSALYIKNYPRNTKAINEINEYWGYVDIQDAKPGLVEYKETIENDILELKSSFDFSNL